MAWRNGDADWSVHGSVDEGQPCMHHAPTDTHTHAEEEEKEDRQTKRQTDTRDRHLINSILFHDIQTRIRDPFVYLPLLVESCTGNIAC